MSKLDCVLNWIPHGIVRVSFDATRADVVVPKHLRKSENVVLEWGFNLPKPIVDLKIDAEAISGSLSFAGYGVVYCMLRWPAIFCVTSKPLDKVGVWLNDAPESVQRMILDRAGERANAEVRRKRFRLIKGGE